MNSKERVNLSLDWQDTDRPPVMIYTTPEINKRLTDHFGGRDLREVFEIDFRSLSIPYNGPIKAKDGDVFYDIWGAGYKHVNNEFGTYDEAVDLALGRLETMDDVESYGWPSVDDYDFSTVAEQCQQHNEYAVCVGGAGMPDIVNGVSRGRGMQQVLVDVMLDDEVGMAIIDRRVDFFYEFLKRALEAADGGIDIVCTGEDTGTQKGRMVSAEVFDRVFRPRLKKFYDLAHEHGAKAMMHSCGDTSEIQPSFIEMGLDILDAMQPEPPGMDPETIRANCKGKLAFCGLISTQETLPHGTVDDCRAEARHRIDVISKGGGYIFAPAHCIQPDTPIENIIAIYEEALGRQI